MLLDNALPNFHKIFQISKKVLNSTPDFFLCKKGEQSIAKILDDFLLSIGLTKYTKKLRNSTTI